MKDLMTANIYEVEEKIIIVGNCLKNMQPEGFEKLKNLSNNIYEVCLEQIHINMVITKVCGMIRTGKVKNIIFASVDKSPHCIQLHYIQDEIKKIMNLDTVHITNYVIVENDLIEISAELISLSKNLSKLKDYNCIND